VTDPGPVVLDEVVGQWLALAVLVAWRPGVPGLGMLGLSFLLFRAFDVLKPWPISALERLPGGWGIVADDLAAGLAAALVQVPLALALRS
jgi:phosphatidylglycerophosphatase A